MTKPPEDNSRWLFQLFTEIGIINQLSNAEFSRLLAPVGLGLSEFGVLNHFIRVGDGTTPSRLARIFQMTKPSMTAIISKLEARNYVDVTPSPADRRRKIVTITDAGRAAREAGVAATEPLGKIWSRELDASALKAAMPSLVALREYLDQSRNHADRL